MAHNSDYQAATQAHMLGRVDQLRRNLSHMDITTLVGELDNLRRIGSGHQMTEVVDIIHSFESALARSRCDTMALHYLDTLADAIGASSQKPRAESAFLASLAVYGVA